MVGAELPSVTLEHLPIGRTSYLMILSVNCNLLSLTYLSYLGLWFCSVAHLGVLNTLKRPFKNTCFLLFCKDGMEHGTKRRVTLQFWFADFHSLPLRNVWPLDTYSTTEDIKVLGRWASPQPQIACQESNSRFSQVTGDYLVGFIWLLLVPERKKIVL